MTHQMENPDHFRSLEFAKFRGTTGSENPTSPAISWCFPDTPVTLKTVWEVPVHVKNTGVGGNQLFLCEIYI